MIYSNKITCSKNYSIKTDKPITFLENREKIIFKRLPKAKIEYRQNGIADGSLPLRL